MPIGINDSSRGASYICFTNPADNRPYKANVLVQPYGSRVGPSRCGRVATFPQFLEMELRLISAGAFVDDAFCAGSRRSAMCGFWAAKQLCGTLGFNTSPWNDKLPTTCMVLLGALVSVADTYMQAGARGDRIAKLMGRIAQAPELDCRTPAAASKLRGKLGPPPRWGTRPRNVTPADTPAVLPSHVATIGRITR